MINYNKNKLINQTLNKYYETFSLTLDTVDFVPEKYNKKICKYIFKNMKKSFKKIDKEDRKYQRKIKKMKELKGGKLMGFFTGKQKKMAKKYSFYDLQRGYQNADLALERASYSGNQKELKNAMKEHRKYEYALLYRNTPEFKKKFRKR